MVEGLHVTVFTFLFASRHVGRENSGVIHDDEYLRVLHRSIYNFTCPQAAGHALAPA